MNKSAKSWIYTPWRKQKYRDMPVRDRRYEYLLQAIFGGMLVIVAVIEMMRRMALWLDTHIHILQ